MKRYQRWFSRAMLVWCLFIPVAHAGGPERLQAYFKETLSFRAEFVQTVFDAQHRIKERAAGNVALARPGKFRWDYRTPYQQLIVANGHKVWVYDADLEQVTVKSMQETVGAVPAQLLSSGEALERSFDITDGGRKEDLEWVELTPRDKDTAFERIRLGFAERDLRAMELVDNLGQTTRLQFMHGERNPRLPESYFEFTPPPGVDVVGE